MPLSEDCSIPSKILSYPGPVVTISNFRSALSSRIRKEWTPLLVKNEMVKLGDKGLGEVVTLERTIAFIKFPPASIPEARLVECGLTMDGFEEAFKERDLNLPNSKQQALLSKSSQYENIVRALN